MAIVWFVRSAEGAGGPYTSSQLKQLAQQGRVTGETELRRGSDEKWFLASKVAGLIEQAAIKPLVPPLPATPEPVESLSFPLAISDTTEGALTLLQRRTIIAVGLIVAACIVVIILMALGGKRVGSYQTPEVVLHFDANDTSNTGKWLLNLAMPYFTAIRNHNTFLAKSELNKVNTALATVTPIKIHWTGVSDAVSGSAVKISTVGGFNTWSPDGVANPCYTSNLRLYASGPAGPEERDGDSVRIGGAISREQALAISKFDRIEIDGTLSVITANGCCGGEEPEKMISFDAIIQDAHCTVQKWDDATSKYENVK